MGEIRKDLTGQHEDTKMMKKNAVINHIDTLNEREKILHTEGESLRIREKSINKRKVNIKNQEKSFIKEEDILNEREKEFNKKGASKEKFGRLASERNIIAENRKIATDNKKIISSDEKLIADEQEHLLINYTNLAEARKRLAENHEDKILPNNPNHSRKEERKKERKLYKSFMVTAIIFICIIVVLGITRYFITQEHYTVHAPNKGYIKIVGHIVRIISADDSYELEGLKKELENFKKQKASLLKFYMINLKNSKMNYLTQTKLRIKGINSNSDVASATEAYTKAAKDIYDLKIDSYSKERVLDFKINSILNRKSIKMNTYGWEKILVFEGQYVLEGDIIAETIDPHRKNGTGIWFWLSNLLYKFDEIIKEVIK